MIRPGEIATSPFPTRLLSIAGATTAGGLLLFLAVRGLTPDPTSNLFYKAQRLEGAGQLELALRHYMLLTKAHPESAYAPRALEREANILTGMARQRGDAKLFRQAIDIYSQLAETYPENSLAGNALLTAGNLAFVDLRDFAAAQKYFTAILNRYPNNSEFASEATLRLGRVALMQKNGTAAQTWFQRVLQRFPNQTERCAEAQYHLGVTYETLFKNKEHLESAKNAYEATIKRYPQSLWASDAKERIGLLYFVDSRKPQERRVWIEVPSLPDEKSLGDNPRSPLAALRLLLAARGVEASIIDLRGWTLKPFFAAYDPTNPSRVVAAPMDAVTNILANAGLTMKPISGGDANAALKDLQNELDDARPTLVFDGKWQLAIGYDSARGHVFFKRTGARLETSTVKDFTASWKTPSPVGGPFTMLSVFTRSDRPRPRQSNRALPTPKPSPTALRSIEDPDPAPTPTPTATPIASLSTPTWVFTPKELSMRDIHRATLRRAAQWMKRPRDDKALLNLEALSALAGELRRLSQSVQATAPAMEPDPELAREETVENSEQSTLEANTTPTPQATATKVPPTRTIDVLERTRELLGWFKGDNTPRQAWSIARLDAAAYLSSAANTLNDPNLQSAARDLRQSIQALRDATAALPTADALSDDGSTLNESARTALATAAQHVRTAREAEARAVNIIGRY